MYFFYILAILETCSTVI